VDWRTGHSQACAASGLSDPFAGEHRLGFDQPIWIGLLDLLA